MRATAFALLILAAVPVHAATWYISDAGTGDATTIQAGMDSATAGDTVLVAPGTYEISFVQMKDGIVLTSEMGPQLTRLVPDGVTTRAIECHNFRAARSEISGFWIQGFSFGGAGAIIVNDSQGLVIEGNVFWDNSEAAVYIIPTWQSSLDVNGNTFYDNELAIYSYGAFGSCVNNIFWGSTLTTGFWPLTCNCFLDISDAGGYAQFNFSSDPQFCGPPGSLYIQSDSPCASGNDPLAGTCGLVGAMPVGCDTVSTEATTWGQVKAMYR
jgi:hypothetical protein